MNLNFFMENILSENAVHSWLPYRFVLINSIKKFKNKKKKKCWLFSLDHCAWEAVRDVKTMKWIGCGAWLGAWPGAQACVPHLLTWRSESQEEALVGKAELETKLGETAPSLLWTFPREAWSFRLWQISAQAPWPGRPATQPAEASQECGWHACWSGRRALGPSAVGREVS